MRLAIADPPYLGRGVRLYGPGRHHVKYWGEESSDHTGAGKHILYTSEHPDAHQWDNPATHHALIASLDKDYDGWALAAAADSLAALLPAARAVHIAVWVNPTAYPASRVFYAWEPVLLRIPAGRRTRNGITIRDVLTAVPPNIGHVGAKPRAWTRWVLDMLGYDPDADTVTDLFPGSGAVGHEIAQQVLKL